VEDRACSTLLHRLEVTLVASEPVLVATGANKLRYQ